MVVEQPAQLAQAGAVLGQVTHGLVIGPVLDLVLQFRQAPFEIQQHIHIAPRGGDGNFQRQSDTATAQYCGQFRRQQPVAGAGGMQVMAREKKTWPGKQSQLDRVEIQLWTMITQFTEKNEQMILEQLRFGWVALAAGVPYGQIVKAKRRHYGIFLLVRHAVQIDPDMTAAVGPPLLEQLEPAPLQRAIALYQNRFDMCHTTPFIPVIFSDCNGSGPRRVVRKGRWPGLDRQVPDLLLKIYQRHC